MLLSSEFYGFFFVVFKSLEFRFSLGLTIPGNIVVLLRIGFLWCSICKFWFLVLTTIQLYGHQDNHREIRTRVVKRRTIELLISRSLIYNLFRSSNPLWSFQELYCRSTLTDYTQTSCNSELKCRLNDIYRRTGSEGLRRPTKKNE